MFRPLRIVLLGFVLAAARGGEPAAVLTVLRTGAAPLTFTRPRWHAARWARMVTSLEIVPVGDIAPRPPKKS